jgi:D-alanyl-D-alanine carboxypeptidase
MQVNNSMRIGSITKTFTATVILRLVDQHKLGLDDPVSTYQPYFAPGKGWHYSNTNTVLLGLIIEQLTHRPAEQAFQRYIFGPLGMPQSSLPPRSSSAIPAPHAQGYMYGTDFTGKGPLLNVTDWNPSWGWTAGSAISTLHDLKVWAKALATGRLLSAATHKEQLSFLNLAKGFGYGLGVVNFRGFIGHNGSLPGYQSWMGYQPQQGATIIVLVNLNVAASDSEPPIALGPADELAKVIQRELFA